MFKGNPIFRSSTSPFTVFGEKKTASLPRRFLFLVAIWGFPKMVGFPNNHGLMIILGCEMGGNPPFKETPISPRNHSLWSQCVLLLHHPVDDRSMFEASNRNGPTESDILHPWKSNWGTPFVRGWWQRVSPFFLILRVYHHPILLMAEIPNNHLRWC